MEIPKTYSDKLTIVIPLKETCGESIQTAIEISGVHINYLIPIQTKIIQYLFDDEPCKILFLVLISQFQLGFC